MRRAMTILLSLATAYLAVVAVIYLGQRSLLYFPDRTLGPPGSHGFAAARAVSLQAEDGVRLTAWAVAPRGDMPVIVYFHGNGANLANRVPRFGQFSGAGYGLLALSYRGYGSSEGRPSEDGFYHDARAALDHARTAFPGAKIVLYGESLGTGIATRMARETDVAAVILEAPYTSVAARAQEIYWWLPASYLIRDRFDNAAHIAGIDAPLVILHSEDDRVIPVHHGRALLEMAKAPKLGIFLPGQPHHLEFDAELLARVSDFLKANQVF